MNGMLGLAVLAFCSGMAALMQQVVALRLLRLEIGGATAATGIVLAVTMAGVAGGAIWGARLAVRHARPLRLYGWVQLGAAAGFTLLPLLLRLLAPLHLAAYRLVHDQPLALGLVRGLLTSLLLALPCLLLGCAWPLLAAAVGRGRAAPAATAGRLYAWNTAGGAAGALAATFLGMPRLGVLGTLTAASLLGAAVGLAAWRASRNEAGEAQDGATRSGENGQKNSWGAAVGASANSGRAMMSMAGAAPLWLAAGGGALILLIETAWTRILAVWLGASAHAFGLMLAIFIAGLGIGNGWGSRLARRGRRPQLWIALSLPLGASLALLATRLLPAFTLLGLRALNRSGASFAGLLLSQTLVLALLLLPAAVALGWLVPLLLAAPEEEGEGSLALPRRAGRLAFAGGLGSLAGSLGAAFWLIPCHGVEATLRVGVVAAGLAGGFWLWHGARRRIARIPAAAGLALAGLALAWGLAPMETPLLAQGLFARWVRTGATSTRTVGRILYHSDGWTAAVTVRELDDGERILDLDGKPDASSVGDLPNQSLLAHLPLLLHPAASNVAIVGLASGVSVASAACHPVARIDCAEIEPAMRAACRYFDDVNRSVLDDPRVHVTLTDGRLLLAARPGRYDVIVSEPSNPWVAGMADLFTQEYFLRCRRALAPGGIACIWLETYALDSDDFRAVLATFRSVFPHVQLWSAQLHDYLLIGSETPLKLPVDHLLTRFERQAVFRDLARIGIRSLPDLLAGYVMDDGAVARHLAGGGRLLRDGGRSIEYTAPRALLRPDNAATVLAGIEANRGWSLDWLLPGELDPDEYVALCDRTARCLAARAAVSASRLAVNARQLERSVQHACEAARLNPDDLFLRRLVQSLENDAARCLTRGDAAGAARRYADILRILPERASAHYGAALADRNLGRKESSYWRLARAVAAAPESVEYRLALADAAWALDKQAEAIRQYRLALQRAPRHAGALHNLALALSLAPAPLGDLNEAIRLGEEAARLTNYRDYRIAMNLANLYLKAGRMIDGLSLKRRLRLTFPEKPSAGGGVEN